MKLIYSVTRRSWPTTAKTGQELWRKTAGLSGRTAAWQQGLAFIARIGAFCQLLIEMRYIHRARWLGDCPSDLDILGRD